MMQFLVFVVALMSFCEADVSQTMAISDGVTPHAEIDFIEMTDAIENTLKAIETSSELAKKLASNTATQESEPLLDEIIETFESLVSIVDHPDVADIFLRARGIDRAIEPNLHVDYSKLRAPILMTLKTLFYAAPNTTKRFTPTKVLDKLLDIFENDDNLAMKAHVVDIFYIMLPENPKMQVRVMKLKGLEPFYEQFAKLDTSVISNLLDLFNKILQEHIKVRYDRHHRIKMDSDDLLQYQRIGLIERMSTPHVCKGLINMFISTWSYTNENNEVIVPVFQLIKKMTPYCMKVLRGNARAIELFEALLKYVKDESKIDYFKNLHLNTTDARSVLENYVSELQKQRKDEF